MDGIPFNTKKENLLKHFSAFNPKGIELKKGFAFISFEKLDEKNNALKLDRTSFNGHILRVQVSKNSLKLKSEVLIENEGKSNPL